MNVELGPYPGASSDLCSSCVSWYISASCNFVFIPDLWLLPSVTHYISVPSNLKYPAQQLPLALTFTIK